MLEVLPYVLLTGLEQLGHLRLCHPDRAVVGVELDAGRAVVRVVDDDIVHCCSFRLNMCSPTPPGSELFGFEEGLFEAEEHFAQDFEGGGGGGATWVEGRRELDEVAADDVAAADDSECGAQEFLEGDAAGFGGASAGEARGVDDVKINGEVDGASAECSDGFLEAREVEFLDVGVSFPAPVPFGAFAAPYTELVDASVAEEVPDAADDGGVREGIAEVFVAQIGVGVKVDDAKVVIGGADGFDGGQGHEVFAAQEERQFVILHHPTGKFLDAVEGARCVAEAEFEVAAVEDFGVFKVHVLIRAVGFEAIGFSAHRAAREARAGAVRGGRVEGRAVQDDAACFVFRFAAEEGFDITVQWVLVRHRGASPLRSLAGRRRLRAAGCCSNGC